MYAFCVRLGRLPLKSDGRMRIRTLRDADARPRKITGASAGALTYMGTKMQVHKQMIMCMRMQMQTPMQMRMRM